MSQFFAQLRKIQGLLVVLIWIFLWLIPWGNFLYLDTNIYVTFIIGLLCLGLALILFTMPGAILYLLFSNRSDNFFFLGIIPAGFVFSTMIIGIIGLIGRIAGFSFDVTKFLFFLFGLVELLIISKKNLQIYIPELMKFLQNGLSNKILLFGFCLSFLLTFNDLLFFIDDTTYLAYLTNWQSSEKLGFQNIIHESAVLELERFWLAMYPMGQAILSDLSGIPGILLFSNYLELLLVPLAVLTSYWFSRQLGLTRRVAGISVLVQVSFFAWMIGEIRPVGTWFYNSIAEDKVSSVFHSAPVFFVFFIKYFENASWKNLILAIFAGVALTLTHPVSLFFACVIVLLLGILNFVLRKNKFKQLFAIIILLALLMVPYLLIRLFNHSSQAGFVSGVATSAGATFEIERYIYRVNDTFYGLNPDLLLFFDLEVGGIYYFFRLIPVFAGLIALILSFFNLRKGLAYEYVFCSSLLVFFVTLPYTGWLFGYFTDTRLISRAAWFAPWGLGVVLICQLLLHKIRDSQARLINKFVSFSRKNYGIFLFFILFTSPVLFFMNLSRIPLFFKILDNNSQLAEIGSHIDLQSNQKVVSIALNYGDMLMLPGVSARTTLISFREEKLDNGHNHYLTEDEIEERIYASTVIRSLKTDEKTSQERCEFIDEYDVSFVVADNSNADLYSELIRKCGIAVEKIYQTKDKVLLQIQP